MVKRLATNSDKPDQSANPKIWLCGWWLNRQSFRIVLCLTAVICAIFVLQIFNFKILRGPFEPGAKTLPYVFPGILVFLTVIAIVLLLALFLPRFVPQVLARLFPFCLLALLATNLCLFPVLKRQESYLKALEHNPEDSLYYAVYKKTDFSGLPSTRSWWGLYIILKRFKGNQLFIYSTNVLETGLLRAISGVKYTITEYRHELTDAEFERIKNLEMEYHKKFAVPRLSASDSLDGVLYLMKHGNAHYFVPRKYLEFDERNSVN